MMLMSRYVKDTENMKKYQSRRLGQEFPSELDIQYVKSRVSIKIRKIFNVLILPNPTPRL